MLSCIVAIDKNNAIGIENTLPWRLSEDLKFFKELTTGNHIIMGRKTYDSIGKPLPNRENIIITRQKNYKQNHCLIINDFYKIVEFAHNKEQYFLIGGAEIYQQLFKQCDKLYLTVVDTIIEKADAFFPKIDFYDWKKISSKQYTKSEKNEFNFTISEWIRKK